MSAAPATAQAARTVLVRWERLLAAGSVAALVLLLGLFQFIVIDGAVIAHGQVVVQGKPRPVQSLESGVVRDIRVRNGDTVAAGDILIRLDPTILQINRDIVRGRLAELIARRSRLAAEERQLDDIPPPEVPVQLEPQSVEGHLAGQRKIFQSRRAVLESQKAQLAERIEQHKAQISGLEAQIVAGESQISFVVREVKNLEVLNEQGLVPESRLLDLQGRQASLQGEVALNRSELDRVRNSIRDTELKIVQEEREFHEQVVTELREVTAGIDENTLELARIDETLERLNLRAPVSGIVHEMQVWTSGGVVPEGETLLTVVPVSDGVEFEVQVAPEAIDVVYLGQEVRLRFPAFDQRTTPELIGTISGISPDSVMDPATRRAFYRVDVALLEGELPRLGKAELLPGMPVEAFLQTSDRTILSFLVKPFLDQMALAFREN